MHHVDFIIRMFPSFFYIGRIIFVRAPCLHRRTMRPSAVTDVTPRFTAVSASWSPQNSTYMYMHQLPHTAYYVHRGCPRRNVPDFGRMFLMLKYTDITQNTYIQSWTVMEIMAREKWGLLAVPNTATCTADASRDSVDDLESGMQC